MVDRRYPIEGVKYVDSVDAARYRATGAWVESNAGDLLRSTAKRLPKKWAVISQERRITYAELEDDSERLGAALLELGLAPGDRVLFQMGTVIEAAIALFACFKAGLVPLCSLPQYREIEMFELARISGARAWFVQADFSAFNLTEFAVKLAADLPKIQQIIVARGPAAKGTLNFDTLINSQSLDAARAKLAQVSVGTEDVLTFQLSGGTTGVPKIIPRFHGEYLGQARDWACRNAMDSDLVVLYALPLIHNAGQVGSLFPAVLLGGTLVLMQSLDPEDFFDWVERESVTHSLNIGPAAAKILNYTDLAQHELSSVRLMTSFNRADVLEHHMKVRCANIFGITEGLLMCSAPEAPEEARFGTVGWPVSCHDEIRILEPGTERDVIFGEAGELCFRGPSSTRGYFCLPEVNRSSFTSDGFFRTGDLMRAHNIDGHVCYSFEDRLKDNIDRGGEKFGAEAVENIIIRHPDVIDVKVVAMPDPTYGEKACAYMIMRPGKALLSVKQLGEFLIVQGLAKFKIPERIEGIQAFPTTQAGKVDKAAMRRMIADKLTREVVTTETV